MATDQPEPPAVATRVVTLTAIGFLVFVGISLVVLHFYYTERIDQAVFVPPVPFAKPRLQTNDVDELDKLQAEQRARLGSYAWVDREKNIIAIPIESAMKHVVARGADAYAPIDAITPLQHGSGTDEGKKP